MNSLTVPTAALQAGTTLSCPIFDDEGKKLLGGGIPITADLITRLIGHNILTVLVRDCDATRLPALGTERTTHEIRQDRPGQLVDIHTPASRSLDSTAENTQALKRPHIAEAFAAKVKARGCERYDSDAKRALSHQHEGSVRQLDDFVASLEDSNSVAIEQVTSITEQTIAAATDDIDLFTCLGISPTATGYPTRHSTHVSKLAVSVGISMGLDQQTLAELSVGCLLHDIGMLKVDPAVVRQDRPLRDDEFAEIAKHPINTLEMIEGHLESIPLGSRMVAYQMHERGNGSGYPRCRSIDKIHALARVAAVADSYVALVTPRPHRAGIVPYYAIKKILQDVPSGLFESDVVRALLHAISLFPLGSFVELSDRRIGRVLRANKNRYDRPIVEVWNPRSGPAHASLVDLVEEPALRITKALTSLD